MGREDEVESENKAESNTESGTEGPWLSVFFILERWGKSRQKSTNFDKGYGKIWKDVV